LGDSVLDFINVYSWLQDYISELEISFRKT